MAFITRDQFLAADDLPTVEVPLPEAYGTDAVMLMRMLTGTERAEIEKRYSGGERAVKDPGGFRARLLSTMCVGEDGKLLFTQDDAAAILEKNAKTIEDLVTKACDLCGFTKKDVEDIAKNSESSQ